MRIFFCKTYTTITLFIFVLLFIILSVFIIHVLVLTKCINENHT